MGISDLFAEIPDDLSIDLRFEGDGITTLWVDDPSEVKKFRAFVGKGHCSEHGEGWGDTREEAIRTAFEKYQSGDTAAVRWGTSKREVA
jgi:hypothetical protein